MNKWIQYGISILVALALNGCGGGGGGGSSTSTIGAAQIAINNTNAPSVGGAVAGASKSSTNLSTTGSSLIGGVSVNGGTNTGLVQFAEWQLSELSKLSSQPANLIGAVVVSGSQSCSGGGSFSYNYNDADNNGILSIGETLSITFGNCIISAGAPVSGSMTLVLSSKTGTPGVGAWSGNLTMTFSNLTMSGEHLTGDVIINLSTSNSSNINATLSGSSLSVTNSIGKVTILSGYNLTVAYDKTTNAYTIGASGTVNRSDLGGTVSFNTSLTLAGSFNNIPDNPVSGVLLVTGANNSKLRLTAVDNNFVELAVDANGDGTYETTSTTTWAAIDAL